MIGAGLKLPVRSLPAEEAKAHFGWLAMFVGMDMPASSAATRQSMAWQPSGPKLFSDLQEVLAS